MVTFQLTPQLEVEEDRYTIADTILEVFNSVLNTTEHNKKINKLYTRIFASSCYYKKNYKNKWNKENQSKLNYLKMKPTKMNQQ